MLWMAIIQYIKTYCKCSNLYPHKKYCYYMYYIFRASMHTVKYMECQKIVNKSEVKYALNFSHAVML